MPGTEYEYGRTTGQGHFDTVLLEGDAAPVVDPDHVQEIHVEPRRRWTAWVAGFVVALVLAAAAIIAYLGVSEDDNDGSVDVPAVEVDVSDGSTGTGS